MSKSVSNSVVKVSLWTYVLFLLSKYREVELLDKGQVYIYFYKKLPSVSTILITNMQMPPPVLLLLLSHSLPSKGFRYH